MIINRRMPCRHPIPVAKSPTIFFFQASACATKADDCCCEGSCSTPPPVSGTVMGTRYSGKWQAWTVQPAPEKWRMRSASQRRQPCPCSVRHRKLVVDAGSDIRLQVESAVQKAGYTLRDEQAPDAAPESRFKENLPLISLIIMMAISWGWSSSITPLAR